MGQTKTTPPVRVDSFRLFINSTGLRYRAPFARSLTYSLEPLKPAALGSTLRQQRDNSDHRKFEI
jgi:hypothetical protein